MRASKRQLLGAAAPSRKPARLDIATGRGATPAGSDVLITVRPCTCHSLPGRDLNSNVDAPVDGMRATMPPRKQSKRLAAKPSSSAARATGPAKKRRRLSPGTAEPALRQRNGASRKRLTKTEQKRFKRFQKDAKKAGLLVSRISHRLRTLFPRPSRGLRPTLTGNGWINPLASRLAFALAKTAQPFSPAATRAGAP